MPLPGRLERRGADEIWDGAHTPDGVGWLLAAAPGSAVRRRRLDPRATRTSTGCCGALRPRRRHARRDGVVEPRAPCPPRNLQRVPSRGSSTSRRSPIPAQALARARELRPRARRAGHRLALPARRPRRPTADVPWPSRQRLSVFVFAAIVDLRVRQESRLPAGYIVGKTAPDDQSPRSRPRLAAFNGVNDFFNSARGS